MHARISVVSILSALFLLTSALAGEKQDASDLEKAWYGQCEKNFEITVSLQRGKIVFVMKELKDRKLILPVIMRYNEKQQLESIIWAKEAELLHDSKTGALLVDVRDANMRRLGDGSHMWVASRIFSFPLSLKK